MVSGPDLVGSQRESAEEVTLTVVAVGSVVHSHDDPHPRHALVPSLPEWRLDMRGRSTRDY